MKCEKCGIEFEPSDEVKRLMVVGAVERYCDDCAVPPPAGDVFKRKETIFAKRQPGCVLHRVDKFNPDGVVTQWMSLPPLPRRRKPVIRKRTWRHEISTTVLSEKEGRTGSEPRLTIRTNIDTFRPQGKDLMIEKIPGGANSVTGIDRITVASVDIDCVEDTGGFEVNVLLKDGGKVRFQYRN